MENTTPNFLLIGQLTRDFTILPTGKVMLDVPGGNVLYASVGNLVWEQDVAPGMVARVGEDYPPEWVDDFSRWGIDTRGVRFQAEPIDVRAFSVYIDNQTRYQDDAMAHFSRLGLPFPRALLGYHPPASNLDSRTRLQPTSLRQVDFPSDFLDASAAHLCPIDYMTHSLVPAILRQAEFTTITLNPAPGYMNPTYWNDIPALLTGLTAFLPSENDIRTLFQGRTTDLWEMAEALAVYGCEIIVIKRGENGQLVYDAASHMRWEIPSYPSKTKNAMGAGDAFCGGFLFGYRHTYDPLQAALYGNISASLVVEGSPANYALGALPGLAAARLESLQMSVRKV